MRSSRGFSACRPARLRDQLCSRLLKWSSTLDLNYLYHRHQVSLFMADNADCEQSRRVHRELADGYAARIAQAKTLPIPASAA